MAYDPRTGAITFPGFDSTNTLLSRRTAAAPAASTTMGPESTYDKYLRVMTGGKFSDLMSGGDKLMALSALLGSVTRGSKVTPQEVIANIRKQQLGKIEAKYVGEGFAQRSKLFADFAKTLPQNEQNMFMLLSEDGKEKFMLARQQGRKETDAEEKLRAAGIDPASPEGQRILRNVAASQGIISVTGPAGTTYKQASEIVFGAPAPAGVTFTPITSPTNAGGPTRPASGGFRGR